MLLAKDIHDAALAALEAAYVRLTARPVPVSWSRCVLERRVEMALLAATDRAGHAGVPRGVAPDPYSVGPEPEDAAPRCVMTSVARVIVALPPPGAPAIPAKGRAMRVRATGRGASSPRPGSERHAVLQFVAAAEDATASVEALDAALGYDCRGHVRKLLDKDHLEIVYEIQTR